MKSNVLEFNTKGTFSHEFVTDFCKLDQNYIYTQNLR